MIQNGLSWTTEKPTKPGWYSAPRHEHGQTDACVAFDSHKVFYVNFLAVHEESVVERLPDTRGEWAGTGRASHVTATP